MRVIESEENTSAEDDSDDRSDVLEIRPKKKEPPHHDEKKDSVNDHTDEYWKYTGHLKANQKTKGDWVEEDEALNRGHQASESFAVLNELVVVLSPLYSWLTCRIVDPIRF
jgi:hypothetical protein